MLPTVHIGYKILQLLSADNRACVARVLVLRFTADDLLRQQRQKLPGDRFFKVYILLQLCTICFSCVNYMQNPYFQIKILYLNRSSFSIVYFYTF